MDARGLFYFATERAVVLYRAGALDDSRTYDGAVLAVEAQGDGGRAGSGSGDGKRLGTLLTSSMRHPNHLLWYPFRTIA